MSAFIFAKLLGCQLLVMLMLLIVGYCIEGVNGLQAVGLGSLVAILSNLYFTLQAFRIKASLDPVKVLGALYRGEVGKFVLVMVFCALIFKFMDVQQPLLLFITLFVILVTQPIVSVLVLPDLKNQGKR